MGDQKTCRAKFKCESEKKTQYSRTYEFLPVVGGSEENDQFFKTTPGGEMAIIVANDGVSFEVGKSYYLDFIEVAEAETNSL